VTAACDSASAATSQGQLAVVGSRGTAQGARAGHVKPGRGPASQGGRRGELDSITILGPGSSLDHVITYTITDGEAVDSATITVRIFGAADPPV
jgi:hypothetical protein